jgi:ubiquinone/menaquinone biosynthesis C-methylase UbiE
VSLDLNKRFFARFYPALMEVSERAGLDKVRRDLVEPATGRTLEIGTGMGNNIPHFTSAVTELVLTEPSPYMRKHLEEALARTPPSAGKSEVLGSDAERLEFPDNSFDTVVGTFVLCTADRPAQVLEEVARVLRPGGHYLFMEHTQAKPGSWQRYLQKALRHVHHYLFAGCDMDTRPEQLIPGSPLEVDHLEHGILPGAGPTLRWLVTGSASAKSTQVINSGG